MRTLLELLPPPKTNGSAHGDAPFSYLKLLSIDPELDDVISAYRLQKLYEVAQCVAIVQNFQQGFVQAR